MKRSDVLSKKEQKTLLELARTSIAAKFSGRELLQFKSPFHRLEETRGVFVTLKKDDKLRGCIGFVMGVKPLYQTVQEVAEASAFQDPRFSPLKEDELKDTVIEISVVTALRKISSIKMIKVKRDGLLVKRGDSQGLLLPQVAKKNKWKRQTFLEHVCLKAGLDKDDWKNPGTEIMTFSAQIFEETHQRLKTI